LIRITNVPHRRASVAAFRIQYFIKKSKPWVMQNTVFVRTDLALYFFLLPIIATLHVISIISVCLHVILWSCQLQISLDTNLCFLFGARFTLCCKHFLSRSLQDSIATLGTIIHHSVLIYISQELPALLEVCIKCLALISCDKPEAAYRPMDCWFSWPS
jgi:hypothetical protein